MGGRVSTGWVSSSAMATLLERWALAAIECSQDGRAMPWSMVPRWQGPWTGLGRPAPSGGAGGPGSGQCDLATLASNARMPRRTLGRALRGRESMAEIQFTLNGARVSVDLRDGASLLEVLREGCGLTSMKDGCTPDG